MLNWTEHEDQDERALHRRTFFPLLVWAIVIGLVVGIVFYASKVGAAPLKLVYRDDSTVIRLLDGPCTNASALAQIELLGEQAEKYRAATVEWKGTNHEACHAVFVEQGAVCLVVDGLGHGDMALEAFKKETGA